MAKVIITQHNNVSSLPANTPMKAEQLDDSSIQHDVSTASTLLCTVRRSTTCIDGIAHVIFDVSAVQPFTTHVLYASGGRGVFPSANYGGFHAEHVVAPIGSRIVLTGRAL